MTSVLDAAVEYHHWRCRMSKQHVWVVPAHEYGKNMLNRVRVCRREGCEATKPVHVTNEQWDKSTVEYEKYAAEIVAFEGQWGRPRFIRTPYRVPQPEETLGWASR